MLCECSGGQAEVTGGSGLNNMGQVAEDVTAPVQEAASEAVKAAGNVPLMAPASCLAESMLAWVCLAELTLACIGAVQTLCMHVHIIKLSLTSESGSPVAPSPVAPSPVAPSPCHQVLARTCDTSCLLAAHCASMPH